MNRGRAREGAVPITPGTIVPAPTVGLKKPTPAERAGKCKKEGDCPVSQFHGVRGYSVSGYRRSTRILMGLRLQPTAVCRGITALVDVNKLEHGVFRGGHAVVLALSINPGFEP
jgi:hypothetical protein